MNILVIDIGNTRIKWGLSEAGGWVRQGWVDTARAGELAAEFAALPVAQRTMISNVAGAAVRVQVTAALNAAAPEPLWIISTAAQCGVSSGYAAPETLGPDRWAALIGAWHLTGAACVVVAAARGASSSLLLAVSTIAPITTTTRVTRSAETFRLRLMRCRRPDGGPGTASPLVGRGRTSASDDRSGRIPCRS